MSDAPHLPTPVTPSTATPQHKAAAPRSAKIAVLTISDTRTPETDTSGNYLKTEIALAGHDLTEHTIVKDDAVDIRTVLTRLMRDADVILTSGGTGIAGRDVTIPVVESLIIKPIPGFGELFRMLSYQQVRGAAMLSRATGGLTRGGLIFAMPGSLNAVQTAWEGILKDEIGHLVFEVARQGQPGSDPMRREATLPPAPVPRLHPEHINQGASAGIGRHAQPGTGPEVARSDSEGQ